METANPLRATIDYVHANPAGKGLVERVCDWSWSNAGWFEECPLNDREPDPILWE